MAPISMNGHNIDLAEAKQTLPRDASDTNYILIQCDDRVTVEENTKLNELQVIIHEYVGNGSYLCYYEPSSLGRIEALPFVKHATVYHSEHKIAARLKETIDATDSSSVNQVKGAATAEGTIPDLKMVGILLHENVGSAYNQVMEKISNFPSSKIHSGNEYLIQATVDGKLLSEIARLDVVRSIDELHPIVFHTAAARQIMKLDANIATAAHALGLTGADETVAVADSGFDVGNLHDVHPAFQKRILDLIPVGTDKTNDETGHGTHVCGCVAADATSKSMGKVQGTAPGAGLIVQSLWQPGDGRKEKPGFVTVDFNSLFTQAFDRGARIHTNSYGTGDPGKPAMDQAYTSNATLVDILTSKFPELVVCFSAGNQGDVALADQAIPVIGDYASAKNCITVGASGTTRNVSADGLKYDPSGKPGNPKSVATFSTIGPTFQSNRIKPDLVAPGVAILSTASRDLAFQKAKSSSGRRLDDFGKTKDDLYCFGSGTSMAAPVVAGCAAVLREAIIKRRHMAHPPATLIKALLINGTADLKGGVYRGHVIPPAPNGVQGHGLVDLSASLVSVVNTTMGNYFLGTLDNAHRSNSFQIANPNTQFSSGSTLRVTLVYADLAHKDLQNVLELVVSVDNIDFLNKKKRDPNVYISSHLENVAKIIVPNVGPGENAEVTIRVFSDKALRADQSYSVVWSLTDN